MAKINKYWGMVALGAVTAAAAGAIAAAFARHRSLEEAATPEDEFEDNQEISTDSEKKETHEDFISWEATSDETPDEDTSDSDSLEGETTVSDDSIEKDTGSDESVEINTESDKSAGKAINSNDSTEDTADEDSLNSALQEAQRVADAFEEDIAEAEEKQNEEETNIHID